MSTSHRAAAFNVSRRRLWDAPRRALPLLLLLLPATVQAQSDDYLIGIRAVEATEADREALGLRPDDGGIRVAQVLEDGPADQAGILPGDMLLGVDTRPLRSVKQLRAAVERCEGRPLELIIARGDRQQAVSIRPVRKEPLEPTRDAASERPDSPAASKRSQDSPFPGFLQDFLSADLFDPSGWELEIRRRRAPGTTGRGGVSPAVPDSGNSLTLSLRIDLDQLLRLFQPAPPAAAETEGLEGRIRQLEQQLDRLKAQLDAAQLDPVPSDPVSNEVHQRRSS